MDGIKQEPETGEIKMDDIKLLSKEPQKIIVLDDDEDMLEIFKQLFTNIPNVDVKFFNYPNEDFKSLICKEKIDLFILDIIIGSLKTGISIGEEIISNNRGSLFLFVSGYDYSFTSLDHLQGKCVYDFLHKPITKSEFLIRVATLLNIASSYKHSFKNTRIKPRELDNLRQRYMNLIKQDQKLIKDLKEVPLSTSIKC